MIVYHYVNFLVATVVRFEPFLETRVELLLRQHDFLTGDRRWRHQGAVTNRNPICKICIPGLQRVLLMPTLLTPLALGDGLVEGVHPILSSDFTEVDSLFVMNVGDSIFTALFREVFYVGVEPAFHFRAITHKVQLAEVNFYL